jgi:hypothetical protein
LVAELGTVDRGGDAAKDRNAERHRTRSRSPSAPTMPRPALGEPCRRRAPWRWTAPRQRRQRRARTQPATATGPDSTGTALSKANPPAATRNPAGMSLGWSSPYATPRARGISPM